MKIYNIMSRTLSRFVIGQYLA